MEVFRIFDEISWKLQKNSEKIAGKIVNYFQKNLETTQKHRSNF